MGGVGIGEGLEGFGNGGGFSFSSLEGDYLAWKGRVVLVCGEMLPPSCR